MGCACTGGGSDDARVARPVAATGVEERLLLLLVLVFVGLLHHHAQHTVAVCVCVCVCVGRDGMQRNAITMQCNAMQHTHG